MNSSEIRLSQMVHPAVYWWDVAASAMQAFCAASKVATACIDKITQAAVAALAYPMVSSAELLGLAPRSGGRATQGVLQARHEPLAVAGPTAEPTAEPDPPLDPSVPEVEDPPEVEVPMPPHVPPVMPTPKADTHPSPDDEADAAAGDVSSPDTAAGAAAPLSRPALVQAPQGEDGPLVSEADPTSNAG